MTSGDPSVAAIRRVAVRVSSSGSKTSAVPSGTSVHREQPSLRRPADATDRGREADERRRPRRFGSAAGREALRATSPPAPPSASGRAVAPSSSAAGDASRTTNSARAASSRPTRQTGARSEPNARLTGGQTSLHTQHASTSLSTRPDISRQSSAGSPVVDAERGRKPPSPLRQRNSISPEACAPTRAASANARQTPIPARRRNRGRAVAPNEPNSTTTNAPG